MWNEACLDPRDICKCTGFKAFSPNGLTQANIATPCCMKKQDIFDLENSFNIKIDRLPVGIKEELLKMLMVACVLGSLCSWYAAFDQSFAM